MGKTKKRRKKLNNITLYIEGRKEPVAVLRQDSLDIAFPVIHQSQMCAASSAVSENAIRKFFEPSNQS